MLNITHGRKPLQRVAPLRFATEVRLSHYIKPEAFPVLVRPDERPNPMEGAMRFLQQKRPSSRQRKAAPGKWKVRLLSLRRKLKQIFGG